MGIVFGLWLIVLGALAVPGLILSKRPDAKQILDKITPYQGWIGVISFLWGIYGLISWLGMFRYLGLGVTWLFYWVAFTACVVCLLVLGFILGIGVMKTFIKDANAQAKMDQTLAKLSPFRNLLGLIALADGVVLIILSIFH